MFASPFYATASPFFAFEQSDFFGRFIVFCLLIISIIAWTIIIEKYHYLRMITFHSKDFLKKFRSNGLTAASFQEAETLDGPYRLILDNAIHRIASIQGISTEELISAFQHSRLRTTLSESDFELIRCSLEAAVDTEVMKMEENLGLLGSIVSSSPFLGLLGTVWGVMMAFCGMALKGKADINAIAPGVSGALLTTVVALIVAIPSLIGYNQLTTLIKVLSVKFDHFVDEIIGLLRSYCRNSKGK